MGIYLLNISVDIADPFPQYISEDLSYNDQESVVEIIVEKIFGYENAIAEYDDHDTNDAHDKKSNFKIDLGFYCTGFFISYPTFFYSYKSTLTSFENHLIKGFNQIDVPPPKI